uniref:Speckle targeted PIP5K1A-regulated poly(A) polymerase n=2 Tax=Sipha flava TaxID=143950 RepID=A0A2S2QSL2_9HEMI
MENTAGTNHLVEHRKQKKKIIFQNAKPNQVTSKIADNNRIELNMIKNKLEIEPSNENIVISKSKTTPILCIDTTQKCKYSKSSNSVPSMYLEKNDQSKVNKLPFHNISSDQNLIENKKNHCEDIVGQGKLIQFKYDEKIDLVSCHFCHCLFSHDISILTKHASECKKKNEENMKYFYKFKCLICDKLFRKLKDWKSHTVSYCHMQKCMINNNYVSYVCRGCKSVFFGNKEWISNHCKNIHKDLSRLPCIFNCMKDIFYDFIFVDRKNLISWTFCAPCKKYSSSTINCNPQNHIHKKTKHFKCDSCSIYFICSQDIYNYHLLSSEHIMLDRLRAKSNEKLESICNLKLPPIILNRFSIDSEKATCNDCKFQMFPNEKAITVHLADECIYKSNFGRKYLTTIKLYFCAVCDITVTDFKQWKEHLILFSHLIKCYDKSDLVSYTCELCSLHCYGNSHYVREHQDIHPNHSENKLSMFMAFNFQRINKDEKSKDFYYCEDCETYAEVNSNSNHWNKSHKTKLKRIVCYPCKTEFFCIENDKLFIKHGLSSEHIILKYASVNNQLLEQKTSPMSNSKKIVALQNEDQKPCISKNSLEVIENQAQIYFKPFLNWFTYFEDEIKVVCKECNDPVDLTEIALLNHLLICYQDSNKNISKKCIDNFVCLECQFYSNNYDLWEKHAISHVKTEMYYLRSYFCTSCNTLLYGKINAIELHLNNKHKTTTMNMSLETLLIEKQLSRENIACKVYDISCYCEPCNKIFKASDNSNHLNTDSHASVASDLVELFYCKYCEIEFYSSSTVYERHKCTPEHIMMSLEYRRNEIKDVPKPYKLYAYLIKFVTNEELYDATQNIGFFCFVCDYLCMDLCTWKLHINDKKHINSSKSLCMDHYCKICKTLMFGQRKHMFEHYSNRFHSMLRVFKSLKCTNDLKVNDSLLQKTSETKSICNTETTFGDIQKIGNNNYQLEESNNEINSLSIRLNELSLKKPKVNIDDIYPTIKAIDEYSQESNIQYDTSLKMDESNIQQDSNTFGASNDHVNDESHAIDALLFKTNSKQDSNTLLKSNTHSYCNFFDQKIKMLNDMLNQNQEITLQTVNYCLPCDLITSVQTIWDDHILKSHSNIMDGNKSVFCDICNLNQIGPSDNLDEHNRTIEHIKMSDFRKLCSANNVKNAIEIKENKGNTVINKSSNDARPLTTDKQVKINGKHIEKETTHQKIVFEIKGAKSKYRRNGWVELKKIFAAYGYFGLYPKQNSVIIIYRKLFSAYEMIKDKELLEATYEFTISVQIEEEKLPELNRITEQEFGNKEILMKTINKQLEAINNEISNPNMFQRLFMLINAIHRYSGQYFLGSKTYAFGSRMSGLALKESDVDLYFDIANTFRGQLSHDLNAQEDLVRYFGKIFRSQSEFKNIQLITAARVPIVKFLHTPSGLHCDLSFKSGLSTHNTKLVRLYLTLDKRVHWIVCAVVKRWALQNDLKNQSMFTSYALVWLVLFYLMTIDVVPPLKLLRSYANYSEQLSGSDVMFIEDWDCTFCTLEKAKQIWIVPEIPCWDLLFGFFKFYSDFNRLKQFVLCPAIGKALPKEIFYKVPVESPDLMGFNKKRIGRPYNWSMRLKENFHGEGLAVQDPFDLFHNITKTIVPKKLQGFSHLCTKTMEVMNNGIQPYYA